MKNLTHLLLALLAFVPACQAPAEAEADAHADDHAEMPAHIVELTGVQMQKIGLKLDSIQPRSLRATIRLNGRLELPPQNQADVSALTAGQVTDIRVRPGEYVRKGQVLATLQNPELIDWQEQYLTAAAELVYLEQERERQRTLVAEDAGARKVLQETESRYAQLEARRQATAAKLRSLGLGVPKAGENLATAFSLRAPLSGYVRQINVTTGAYVQPGFVQFQLVDNHHIHADLLAYERDLPLLHEGQRLVCSLTGRPGVTFEAKIFAIGKALEGEERAIRVHAEIVNQTGDLLPGMFIEAMLIEKNVEVPTLPEQAVITDRGLQYIFVRDGADEEHTQFRQVQVTTGTTDLGYTEVEPMETLAPDAQVVTEGVFFLLAESKKGEESAGHAH